MTTWRCHLTVMCQRPELSVTILSLNKYIMLTPSTAIKYVKCILMLRDDHQQYVTGALNEWQCSKEHKMGIWYIRTPPTSVKQVQLTTRKAHKLMDQSRRCVWCVRRANTMWINQLFCYICSNCVWHVVRRWGSFTNYVTPNGGCEDVTECDRGRG